MRTPFYLGLSAHVVALLCLLIFPLPLSGIYRILNTQSPTVYVAFSILFLLLSIMHVEFIHAVLLSASAVYSFSLLSIIWSYAVIYPLT